MAKGILGFVLLAVALVAAKEVQIEYDHEDHSPTEEAVPSIKLGWIHEDLIEVEAHDPVDEDHSVPHLYKFAIEDAAHPDVHLEETKFSRFPFTTFRNLSSDHEYIVEVKRSDLSGKVQSAWVKTTAKTLSKVPHAPIDVKVTAHRTTSHSAVTIHWHEDEDAHPEHYEVAYSKHKEWADITDEHEAYTKANFYKYDVETHEEDGSHHNHKDKEMSFGELHPNTTYYFRLREKDGRGFGHPSKAVEFYTHDEELTCERPEVLHGILHETTYDSNEFLEDQFGDHFYQFSKIHFDCEEGFELVGEPDVTCYQLHEDDHPKWYPELPECFSHRVMATKLKVKTKIQGLRKDVDHLLEAEKKH